MVDTEKVREVFEMNWHEIDTTSNQYNDYIKCKWCSILILPTIAICNKCGGEQ